jgi:DnaJ-class molecular chaperone
LDKPFDPESYGMTFCPLCQGEGKLAKTHDEVEVCRECGGFGLVKTEGDNTVDSRSRRRKMKIMPGLRKNRIDKILSAS